MSFSIRFLVAKCLNYINTYQCIYMLYLAEVFTNDYMIKWIILIPTQKIML